METNVSYEVISWDRLKNVEKVYPHEHQYKVYAPYANGMKNIFSLIGWVFFVWFMLLKYSGQYKVIHAVNLENYLLAIPFKLLGKKIVIDIYDTISVNQEHNLVPKADLAILPTAERLKQLNLTREEVKNFLEVENVPTYAGGWIDLHKIHDDKIHLSYVGVMQKDIRGIENVLDVVLHDDRFVLDIAGCGNGLDNVVAQYASNCERIHYHGKVQYNKALEIMKNSDYIVALYYLSAPVHKYASPNKFYESLFIGTPIITSKNTLVGARVEDANTGYTVEDTKIDFLSVFENYGTPEYVADYNQKAKNCRHLWDSVYATYKEDVLKCAYIEAIKKLAK